MMVIKSDYDDGDYDDDDNNLGRGGWSPPVTLSRRGPGPPAKSMIY